MAARVLGKVMQSTGSTRERYMLTVPKSPILHTDVNRIHHAPVSASFDLERVVREASRMVDDATEDARRLIEDARKRADAILEKALEMATHLEQDAHEKGLAAGREESLAAMDSEIRNARTGILSIVKSAREQRRNIINDAEPELLRLSYALAEHIIQREIERDSDVVVSLARAAMKRIGDQQRITMRVNPEDLERMRAHREDLLALGDMQEVRVIADPRVDHGGLVLETEAGMIDARILSQLTEAKRVLHLDEETVLEAVGHQDESFRA